MKIKKAFTLAEIMIVLTVMGVLAGILLPIMNKSRPDEAVMKIKKANETLANVINELITSDKYYFDGDLGRKPNGNYVDGNHTGDYSDFCNTFAGNLATKSVHCKDTATTTDGYYLSSNNSSVTIDSNEKKVLNETDATISSTKAQFDALCKSSAKTIGKEIETVDGIVYYEYGNAKPFGTNITGTYTYTTGGCGNYSPSCDNYSSISWSPSNCNYNYQVGCAHISCYCYYSENGTSYSSYSGTSSTGSYTCTAYGHYTCVNKPVTHTGYYTLGRLFSPPDERPAYIGNEDGFDIVYKVFCVDVDGFDETKGSDNCDDKDDICPFGYGIRADGKILPGARADEWLGKEIQKSDDD